MWSFWAVWLRSLKSDTHRAAHQWRASTSPSKNKDAAPDYIPIVCWRERAEFCGRYLSKGRQIVVEGRISTRKWKDEKTGQNRKAVEVVASNIYFADSNGGNANGNPQPANNDGFMDIPDDGQLPFN